jgi:hypothetical protein
MNSIYFQGKAEFDTPENKFDTPEHSLKESNKDKNRSQRSYSEVREKDSEN